MHDRIFQITAEPIPEDNYITEVDFWDHWFVGAVADYVSNDADREEEIELLRKTLEKTQIAAFKEDDSFILLPNAKKTYFRDAYIRFIRAVGAVISATLEEFMAKEISDKMFAINQSFSDKFGKYVSSDEFGTVTFDEFMRKAEIGKRYYIGGVVDYHH